MINIAKWPEIFFSISKYDISYLAFDKLMVNLIS